MKPLHVQRHTGLPAGALHDLPVTVRVGAAQAIVDVQGIDGQSEPQVMIGVAHQRKQRHGIGAARQQQQGVLARKQRTAAGDGVESAAPEPETRGREVRRGQCHAPRQV